MHLIRLPIESLFAVRFSSLLVVYPARMAENLFKMAAYSRKFIQDGGGVLTSSTGCAYSVRTKVGRLRKHSILKSDWFSVILPTL